MSAFSRYAVDGRPLDTVNKAQLSLILGLETVLKESGLVLTCPSCAQDDHATLQTDNAAEDPVWKIDCQCRRRRALRANAQTMTPSGDLLLLVESLLGPLGLVVRCPSSSCLLKPLQLRQTATGVTVICRCGTQRTFTKTQGKPH